jgi:hypothetical protein
MSLEGQLLDRKSLRAVTGNAVDWPEPASGQPAISGMLQPKEEMEAMTP